MKNIAIITARGGSKRIPYKNIKDFLGKPIIAYPIEAAKASGLFDEIIVSTDDDEIASISIALGASVPFMRSEKNSDDFATTFDVLEEVVSKLSDTNINPQNICCIYPTSPLLNSETLTQSNKKFVEGDFDSLLPVVKYEFATQRALRLEDKGNIYWVNENHAQTRSQDLEQHFHDVGQFYWLKTKVLIRDKKIITKKTGHFEIDATSAQDIDTLQDWEMAQIKFKYINKLF